MVAQDFDEQRLSLTWAQNKIDSDDRKRIVDAYRQWVNQPLYFILKKHGESERDAEYRAIRARKRGDEKYERETILRFEKVGKVLRRIRLRDSRRTTRALLVTLTYRDNNASRWKEVGSDYNLFISRARKRYGRLRSIRIWEAHKSGLPHIHALLLFEQSSFRCFSFRSKLRIENKSEFARLWPHGFVDVQGVYNIAGAFGYLKKYLRKTLSFGITGALITLSMLWFHRKRMFAISRDLITHKRNSNSGTWSFIGICTSFIDLTAVWIQEAWKTEKGVKVKWEKTKQQHLFSDAAIVMDQTPA